MGCLIDTNVIIDVLLERKDFVEDSSLIYKCCETKIIDGFVSSLSFANIVYTLRDKLNPDSIKTILNAFTLIFSFADLNQQDLINAADLKWSDYEDAIQAVTASKIKADYIITRNIKDFKNSYIKAITPSEFLKQFV